MSKTTNALIALGVVAGLGAAALPLSSYAADDTPKAVGVTLTIDDELTIEADKDNADNKVDLSADGHTGAVKVTVVSNNTKGYNLALKGSAATNPTSLTSGEDQIVATKGTFAAPAAFGTDESEWGYSVANTNANNTTDLTKFAGGVYAGVPATDQIIVNANKPTVSAGDTTTITFAANLVDGQAAGTYEGEVTFTASNNPNA